MTSLISGITLIYLFVLFIWTFFASFGVPGGLVLIISSGALANDISELILVIGIVVISSIIGDLATYELARRFSGALNKRLENFRFYKGAKAKSRELLSRYSFWLVFYSRFAILGICSVLSYISGFERIERKKFITAVVFGETLYGAFYPFMGFVFKETWQDLASIIGDFVSIVLIAIAVISVLKLRYSKSKHADKF